MDRCKEIDIYIYTHFPANIISLRRHWHYRYVRLKVTSYLHHQAPLSQADALRVEFEALREAEQQTSALSALEVRSCWAARGLGLGALGISRALLDPITAVVSAN